MDSLPFEMDTSANTAWKVACVHWSMYWTFLSMAWDVFLQFLWLLATVLSAVFPLVIILAVCEWLFKDIKQPQRKPPKRAHKLKS